MPTPFSVVIPAFNAEPFITEALDSIARQTTTPLQVVVVDDGSTDSTAMLVSKWSSENDLPLELIRQANRGLPAARNAGIQACRSRWIALLDADDVFYDTHIARLSDAIMSNHNAVAVFCDGMLFGGITSEKEGFSKRKALAAADRKEGNGVYSLQERLFTSLLPGNYIMPSALAFDRTAAEKFGLFNESLRYIEDKDFLLRLSKVGRFLFVDEVTVKCRVHGDNITHPRNTLRNLDYDMRVLDKILGDKLELQLSPDEVNQVLLQLHFMEHEYAYTASTGGMKAYFSALRFLSGRRSAFSSFRLKDMARAAVRSLD